MKIKLGQEVRCSITGFQGIATIRSEHLEGRIRYFVEAKYDGKPCEEWVDEYRLDPVAPTSAGFGT